MSEKRASLEIIAPSVEEAVEKGLADLGLPEEAVDVEILDEGNKGLFGLGSRQARVRLTIRVANSSSAPSEPGREVESSAPMPAPAAASEREIRHADEDEEEPIDEDVEEATQTDASYDLESEITLTVAREIVEDLLERMHIYDQIDSVEANYGEPDDARSRIPVIVDIYGDDLSVLIGPKAETLNALQYIASLIVGKELGRSVPLVVDVQGYRARREQEIRQVARSMAEQAVQTGRRQILEPMTAAERRLVHIELRNNPDVYTESIGEDPRRKVTVIPKSD